MIALSYLIATRNRLPFLKITLEKLIVELQQDEEIVVVDGHSTDGAKAYLQQLFEEGKIHQFISEPDKNQAHAWNKAMLMARGLIIKKIIDDDVFCYDAISVCKKYMLDNPQIDACISNNLQSNLSNAAHISMAGRMENYKNWQSGNVPSFTFSDVTLLLRKASLSYLGLYDTQFKMIDWEYALRLSYLKAKIAYYTGCNALSVATPGNVTSTADIKLLKHEGAIGMIKYDYTGDDATIGKYSRLKIWGGKTLHRFKKRKTLQQSESIPADDELKKIYMTYARVLNDYHHKGSFSFL